MPRIRSPNYPAISLPEAINRVKKIHVEEQHLAADKAVIAKHLGYGGINGTSLKVISALGKYGLLEEAGGDQLRVSKLAMTILFPVSPEQKHEGIREAASKPALFAELLEQWGGDIPSDENLRSYLMRRNFAQSAINKAIGSFRETMALVTPEASTYNTSNAQSGAKEGNKPMPPTGSTQPFRHQPPPPMPGSEQMRVSITSSGVEVTAHLIDAKEVDKLIRTLQATKALLEPVHGAFATEYTDDEAGRAAEERDRKRDEEIDGGE